MSTEALGVLSAAAAAAQSAAKAEQGASPAFLHSPPDSNNAAKSEGSDSELSDLDEEPILPGPPLTAPHQAPQVSTADPPPVHEPPAESDAPVEDDIGEVLPADWSGNVAIFKPTMHQFKDFDKFMAKVNSYGMKSGIIKIVPPKEWLDQQPPLDEMVKTLRVREPIKQDIMGSNGTYRQVNILHGRSYNVPGWKKLCEQSEHQPPARRGERRANADKPKPRRSTAAAPAPKPQEPPGPKKRGRKPKRGGRAGGRGGRSARAQEDRPMTPVSPTAEEDETMETVEHDEPEMGIATRGGKAKTQSVSARRKYQKREGSAMIDEAAFKDFDYKMDISDYTPERCEELERAYWKTLTYAPPLYGADMMGTLFDDRTEAWNLNKLPNLLDVLGTKIPGVNTAYLYFGMWKATFAWHLEDVDLYSINYVHFGAPKQWYSISQADARRFENAMKSIWPADAKACNQFLRHKGFLISPQHLLQNYNIKVNKVVSYPGEFVVTFPYGYHSGYNLGYNCAEAVNFALEPWLEMGKIAKRCECAQAQDSVWINVYEIERKLRGEETDYEETDEDEEDEEDGDEDDTGIHSPHGQVKIKVATRKRKRQAGEKAGEPKVKKIKLRLKRQAEPPCCLCPNDISAMELLPTDDGRKAHRVCALYLPETYIDTVDDHEIVSNVSGIHKDRTELKCLYCRSKRGACFQCSQKKCARAYHPTCAAAAGVFIEEEDVPVFGDDGVEYKEQAFEFSCRFHRTKRDKRRDGEALENDERIREHAAKLNKGDVCQLQYFRGEMFAGIVVENRADEQMLLVDILPSGDRLEIEWKWLAVADPADYHLPKASPNALPLPPSQKAKDKLNAKRSEDERPRKDDVFVPGYTWAEFNDHVLDRNPDQVRVDLFKDDQVWHFIGKGSTDTKAQYTEDPRRQRHNTKANFLDTLPKPPKPVKAVPNPTVRRQSYNTNPGFIYAPGMSTIYNPPQAAAKKEPKPYQYKPKTQVAYSYPAPQAPTYTAQQFVPSTQPPAARPINNSYNYYLPPGSQSGQQGNQAYTQTPAYSQQQFEVKPHRTPMNYHNPKQPYQAPAASPSWGQPSQQNNYQQTQQYPQHPPQGYSQSPVPRPTSSASHPSMSGSPAAHQPAAFSPPAPSHSPAVYPQQRTMSTPSSASAMPKPAQAPAATPTPPPIAAKSNQQRPQSSQRKRQWSLHPMTYEKWPFFQTHYNRDLSKYRTPYAPWGGFTNGFEGDLRAHLMANPQELLRRSSMTSASPPTMVARPTQPTIVAGSSQPPAGVPASKRPAAAKAARKPSYTKKLPPPTPNIASPPPMPLMAQTELPHHQAAVVPEFKSEAPAAPAAAVKPLAPTKNKLQRGSGSTTPVEAPAPTLATRTTPHGTAPKQSHVPLPAKFLAAISSSQPGSPTSATSAQSTAAIPPTQTTAPSQSPAAGGNRISTTPVPFPKFPSMTPHQAAARASTASTGSQVEFHNGETQQFADVPGIESMEFMERMMANLRSLAARL